MITMQSIIAREKENVNRRMKLKKGHINIDNHIENVYYDVLGYEGLYYYIAINRNDIITTDVSRIGDRFSCEIGDRFSCEVGCFLIIDIIEKEFLELKIVKVNPAVFVQRIDIDSLKEQIEEANEDLLEKQMLIQDIYL